MGHGKKWKEVEDKALASAYAELTFAGVKSGVSFWEAIRNRIQGVRSARSQQNRWFLIAQDIKIFIKCLDCKADREKVCSEIVERAKELFHEKEGRQFEFLDCWKLVRNCPKFHQVGAAAICKTPATSEPPSADSFITDSPGTSATGSFPAPVATAYHDKNLTMRSVSKTNVLPKLDLTFSHHQLASEMRRKNDLQEDELALKLFGESRESDESQRFFKLLKRKKILQLEQDVYELEQVQQRRQQRRS